MILNNFFLFMLPPLDLRRLDICQKLSVLLLAYTPTWNKTNGEPLFPKYLRKTSVDLFRRNGHSDQLKVVGNLGDVIIFVSRDLEARSAPRWIARGNVIEKNYILFEKNYFLFLITLPRAIHLGRFTPRGV